MSNYCVVHANYNWKKYNKLQEKVKQKNKNKMEIEKMEVATKQK